MKVKSLSRFQLFATPWAVAYRASLSMGFFRQEYWSGLPFPWWRAEGVVRNVRGLGFHPGLPANKVVCHIFMDADIRNKSLRSVKKDFITPHTVSGMSILICMSVPCLDSYRMDVDRQSWMPKNSGFHHKRGS